MSAHLLITVRNALESNQKVIALSTLRVKKIILIIITVVGRLRLRPRL
jgi:hypothetical protein